MEYPFSSDFAAAQEVADLFELVRSSVRATLGRSRAGLMLGLQPLGFSPQGFIGAYHQVGSNLLVLNASLLKKLNEERPEMVKPYTFHLLLHEYLHSLGIVDEARCRAVAQMVSEECFGPTHVVTHIAEDFEKYLPNMQHAPDTFSGPDGADITLVQGFDRDSTRYIG